jgi:hypothetical protein
MVNMTNYLGNLFEPIPLLKHQRGQLSLFLSCIHGFEFGLDPLSLLKLPNNYPGEMK